MFLVVFDFVSVGADGSVAVFPLVAVFRKVYVPLVLWEVKVG